MRWLALALTVGIVLIAVRIATRPKPQTPHYETAAVDRGKIAAVVTANGTLSAIVMVNVGSQVSGRIESLRADFGAKVTKGQVIATIEPSLFRAAAEQATANFRAALAGVERAKAQGLNAERQYERTKALHAEGLATGADFDAAAAALEVARADLSVARSGVEQTRAAHDQAELNLRYTTILSPIDGIVISRNVDVGQTVAAALQAPTLFSIAEDLTRMQVDTNVSEADVGKIREGMAVTFTVDSYPARTFRGTVRQVRDNAQTIQNVVTYDAVVDVANDDRALRPGMTASVTFTYAERADVIRIPNAALRYRPAASDGSSSAKPPSPVVRGDQRTLWVLRADRAVPVAVRIGVSDANTTELVSGQLEPGERVITELAGEAAKRTP
jgi:HlyD family secretion protein